MKVKLIRATGGNWCVRNGLIQDLKGYFEYRDIKTGKEYVVSSPEKMISLGAEIISQNY
jgi:hypothetical protein